MTTPPAPPEAPASAPADLSQLDRPEDAGRPVTFGDLYDAALTEHDYHAACLAGAGADAPRDIVARRQRQIEIFAAMMKLIERVRGSPFIMQELRAISRAERAATETDADGDDDHEQD
jgi:hypothetical protein